MGLQTNDGRDVRIQQASRSYADVVQLSGAAVCAGWARQDSFQSEPYPMHQVRPFYFIPIYEIASYVIMFRVSLSCHITYSL